MLLIYTGFLGLSFCAYFSAKEAAGLNAYRRKRVERAKRHARRFRPENRFGRAA